MSRTIDIPGGQAVLRDPSDVKVKQRRWFQASGLAARSIFEQLPENLMQPLPENASQEAKDKRNAQVQEALQALSLSGQESAALLGMQDGVILALLESWTLGDPLPKDLDAVGDMDPAVYDALAEATKEDGAKLVMRSFGPTPDKSAPFGNSASFGGA